MRSTIFALFIAQILAAPCYGQQGGPVPLTLAQSLALALEHSPALRISEAKVDAAEARASEVNTQLLPQLKLTARAAALSEVPEMSLTLPPPIGRMVLFPSLTENYATRLTLQQPLFTGFRLIRSKEAASLQSDASKEDRQRDRADLILQVTATYWNHVRARQIERAISSSIAQMEEHVKDVKAFQKNGMATDLDVRKAVVQLSALKVRSVEARNGVRVVSMQLNSLIGQPLDAPVQTTDGEGSTADSSWIFGSYDQLRSEARSARPEIRALELRKQASAAGIGAAKAGWFPSLSLVANYDYSKPNSRIIPPKNAWENTWDVGVNLQWNVWDWLATTHQTAQAEAAFRQTEAAGVQIEDAVALDVAQNQQNAQAAVEMLRVADEGLATADESRRIAEERFRQGVASSTDVLDSQAAAVQADVTRIQARADLAIAVARLERALGRPMK